MGFPNVPRQHHWLEEGIATYVEPAARAQAGLLPVEEVWKRDASRYAQRLAGSGRKRLGSDSFLGQHLLGGALFCLLADVQFRERTGYQRGLQHALRGILEAGGNIEVEWPLVRALRIGDD